jgi:hypothetical protein
MAMRVGVWNGGSDGRAEGGDALRDRAALAGFESGGLGDLESFAEDLAAGRIERGFEVGGDEVVAEPGGAEGVDGANAVRR